jgi:hypothetical protein
MKIIIVAILFGCVMAQYEELFNDDCCKTHVVPYCCDGRTKRCCPARPELGVPCATNCYSDDGPCCENGQSCCDQGWSCCLVWSCCGHSGNGIVVTKSKLTGKNSTYDFTKPVPKNMPKEYYDDYENVLVWYQGQVKNCIPVGRSGCNYDSDCCWQIGGVKCFQHICIGSTCKGTGSSCYDDGDCCSKHCEKSDVNPGTCW